jgi:hypothetical protein
MDRQVFDPFDAEQIKLAQKKCLALLR